MGGGERIETSPPSSLPPFVQPRLVDWCADVAADYWPAMPPQTFARIMSQLLFLDHSQVTHIPLCAGDNWGADTWHW